MTTSTTTFSYSQLRDFTTAIFERMGFSVSDAHLASEVLLSADLRGVDSHGVARLSGYLRLWEVGRINPKAEIKIVHQTPSTARIDAQAGLGLVVAPKAMQIAMEKAEQVGTGWVSIYNSNHYGIAGYHAMLALPKDMIGISMTNASPLVAPTHSQERMLGTNPIAIAIPAAEEPPFVADFATAAAANGKLEILQRKNLPTPEGWVQGKSGETSTNAHALKEGGALLPLGSDTLRSSHKGYCLGAMVDILSAVLSGAGYGPWAPPFVSFLPLPADPVGEGLGHFLGAMRVDAFRPAQEFKSHMDNWIRRFRAATPITESEPVLIPGDIEREIEKIRQKQGIPLLESVWKDLEEVGKKMQVKF
ncbi:Ldh family oxidoreductase [Hugenholtzia roseola]|uniref:Ldh family oxidoreductase n=1 Tax=Hugenholtzia roseola TaxID=1002 RepID=UPI00040FBBFF|nr:Ldh family oxidoreductase [Hugenholtzia roseola]